MLHNARIRNEKLLELWERVAHEPPARRPLTLLAGLSDEDGVEALPIGERDRRLLLIRQELFGDRIEGVTECPQCAARVEIDFSVTDITSEAVALPMHNPVVSHGFEIRWRLPTSQDLVELADEQLPALIRKKLLKRCLLEVKHAQRRVRPSECPEEVINEICDAMSLADPLGDMRLELQCPECPQTWNAIFDIGAYLWKEIDAWARRLLEEVHSLARSYGWSECEILGMSAQRRMRYLELVEA